MALSAVDVLIARKNLQGVAVRTPLTHSKALSDLTGADVYLKWENLQKTGAYKFRGAYNKICSLSPKERKKGVITASSGNHALAISMASRILGVDATVFVPVNAPKVKIAKCEALGSRIVLKGANFDESLIHCLKTAKKTGAVYVPGTEDHKVMAGQGTVGLEILEDVPDVNTIITPVGGGGLITGVGVWAKTVNPSIVLIGVQTTAARSMHDSLKARRVMELPVKPTLADGLAGQISQMAMDHVARYVDDILLADDRGLRSAILWIIQHERQVVEGSAAVGPAILLQHKLSLGKDQKVAVVITGGNIDLDVLGLDVKTKMGGRSQ
ncbi:MAG TPA: threonine/serine dehydratase [Thermoplasmata archaeon]